MTVFDINNYREACVFLQDKYDKLEFERFDYYKVAEDGHLIKNTKVGHGKDGLQYHHICEDIVPSLSDKVKAEANNIEYQKADNMCYANLLEHAWLHILITENNTEASIEAEEDITGIGGVRWMLLALNSIMAGADVSWYSSKDEDGKGCDYNVDNIITDNKKLYDKVINRYCTSPFIRQRLGKTNIELADELCNLFTKRDKAINKVIDHIKEIGKDTKLLDWNINAYADLENYLRDYRTALVWICTGGGKTTTALEYLRVHNCSAIVLGPSDAVKDSWKDESNCLAMTYQTFMNCYKEMDYDKYPVIICDESHHIKAERWGEGVRFAIDNTPAKIIGLTATPTSEQANGTDKEFEGRLCVGLDLAKGIDEGLIYSFGYIQSIYKMEDVKPDFEKYGLAGTELWGRLNLELNKMPVARVLNKHMPEGQRKIIVFCSSIDDMKYAVDTMKEYDHTLEIREITSEKNKKYNSDAKKWFNEETVKNVCLVTVGMVNEGAHYKDVNTLIMFRRTHSTTLYLQQLGRIVVTTAGHKDPNGIVFDFTNNADTLIANQTITIYDKDEDAKSAEDAIKRFKAVTKEKAKGNELIYKDYTNNCAETLKELQEAKNVTGTEVRIYKYFDQLKADIIANEFDFDLWDGFKTKEGTMKILGGDSKHATSDSISKALSDVTSSSKTTSKKVEASDAKKLAVAFTTALRRLYNFNIIDFDDTSLCDVVINDNIEFKKQIKLVGFKSANTFEQVIHKLGRTAYILVTNL